MSYTLLEQYKLKGSISDIDLENLLESHHALSEQVEEIGNDILGDSSAVGVEEDCLSFQITEVKALIKCMGTSKFKKHLLDIVESLEEKQKQLSENSAYGLEELKKVNERWMNVYNML